jgi:hypothetical protein
VTAARPAALILLLGLAGRGRAAESSAASLKHRCYIDQEEIRDSDTRALGRLLVERIHRECDLPGAPAGGETVLGDDAALIMMVPARLFDAIERDGFLNQHQTGTTGGQHRESDRFEAEQELAMLRLPFDANGRELLPKYAILDVKKAGLGTYRLPTQYGGVAVVFKKEVAARATWTYADSLDYSRKAGRFDAGGAANPVLAKTFLYRRKREDGNRCGNYCEAQIWGKLSLDDVAYAMVADSEPVPGALARAGIPVYDYAVPDSSASVVDAGRTAQYVRGALRRAAAPMRSSSRVEPAIAPTKEIDLGDEQGRALELYRQSELPWDVFKPRLLEGLSAAPGPLLISAVALAAEHQDDADVSARLERLRRAPASLATEWVERLTKTRLCSPR